VQANTTQELIRLLDRPNGSIIFTTLQKFNRDREERESNTPFPMLSRRHNLLVVVDEAHCSLNRSEIRFRYAACSYSLISPCNTFLRRTRIAVRSVTGAGSVPHGVVEGLG
jgi:hypothetical protein